MASALIWKLYHEHGYEGIGREEKVLPYMVLIKSMSDRLEFGKYLESKGYSCVHNVVQLNGVLVNTEFKRFGGIYLPVKHSCVGNRDYSAWEFLSEVMGESKDDPFVKIMYQEHLREVKNGKESEDGGQKISQNNDILIRE